MFHLKEFAGSVSGFTQGNNPGIANKVLQRHQIGVALSRIGPVYRNSVTADPSKLIFCRFTDCGRRSLR
jgi:hypothetical protein